MNRPRKPPYIPEITTLAKPQETPANRKSTVNSLLGDGAFNSKLEKNMHTLHIDTRP